MDEQIFIAISTRKDTLPFSAVSVIVTFKTQVLLGSSLNRFACTSVGKCGLEMSDRQYKDTKEIET